MYFTAIYFYCEQKIACAISEFKKTLWHAFFICDFTYVYMYTNMYLYITNLHIYDQFNETDPLVQGWAKYCPRAKSDEDLCSFFKTISLDDFINIFARLFLVNLLAFLGKWHLENSAQIRQISGHKFGLIFVGEI